MGKNMSIINVMMMMMMGLIMLLLFVVQADDHHPLPSNLPDPRRLESLAPPVTKEEHFRYARSLACRIKCTMRQFRNDRLECLDACEAKYKSYGIFSKSAFP
jgi:VanZ family protein